MTIKSRAFTLLAFTALTFLAPSFAHAVDIPLLTWERGRVQQVVLGGGAVENHWKVAMVRAGSAPSYFTPSRPNTAGYIVYTLNIPADLPLGGYTIVTTGNGSPQTSVAAVNLIALTAASVPFLPIDLTFIISMLVALTAAISTLRARKYSPLSFPLTQKLEPALSTVEGLAKVNQELSFATTPYHLRIKAISSLPQSLLRYLLFRNGELLHRLSPSLYAFAPALGILGAGISAVEVDKAGGMAKTSLAIFIAVALLGVIDTFSGLIATLTFWGIELAYGNVTSFRDCLVMVSLAIAWISPGLIAAIFQDGASRDFTRSALVGERSPSRYLALLESALAAGLAFLLGQKLINSLLINITSARTISLSMGVIIGVAVILRALFNDAIEKNRQEGESHEVMELTIARVASPVSAAGIFASYFGFSYIWTQSALRSLIFTAFFTAPLLLLLVRFDSLAISTFARAPRNLFIESLLPGLATLVIFREISAQPLLSSDRAKTFLLLAAIPLLAQALYSAICDSAERKGIIKP